MSTSFWTPQGYPSPRRIGAVVGGVAAFLAYLLAILFLLLTTNQPIGTTPPFTTLTTKTFVFPPVAVVWTVLDAHFVHPSIVFTDANGTRFLIIRDVLDVLDNSGDQFAVLRIVPPGLLFLAGAITATLLRRRSRNNWNTIAGAQIVLGYTPLIAIPGLLARLPVAPNATGEVKIGHSLFAASTLQGLTAYPDILPTLVVATCYPVVFGAFGGWASTLPGRIYDRIVGIVNY